MPPIKTLLTGAVILYVGFTGTSFMIDQIGSSSAFTYPTAPPSANNTNDEDNIAKLLAGADPTDLFEPTAAGVTLRPSCFTGQLEIDSEDHLSLKGANFIGRYLDDEVFITLMTLPPMHLHQDQHQAVTATHLPALPDSVREHMTLALASQSECQARTLYLSRID
ncbi:MAG: hypothetical protein ACPHXW_10190 [Marinobacterium sp.]